MIGFNFNANYHIAYITGTRGLNVEVNTEHKEINISKTKKVKYLQSLQGPNRIFYWYEKGYKDERDSSGSPVIFATDRKVCLSWLLLTVFDIFTITKNLSSFIHLVLMRKSVETMCSKRC